MKPSLYGKNLQNCLTVPATNQEQILITRLQLKDGAAEEFAKWQSLLQARIASFKGFISLEILSPTPKKPLEWVITERFEDASSSCRWLQSPEYFALKNSLQPYLTADFSVETSCAMNNWGVTEVFVTQVHPQKVAAYHAWMGKIHEAESHFQGFKGVYVQSPKEEQAGNWITLLQFDTQEHLDQWITSDIRKAILNEASTLVHSVESHRMISPFSGWFASASFANQTPPTWKQTCVVLLVLFPVVMLELHFLSPLVHSVDLSLATFIANAISVTLVAWPLMPVAIYCLKWWLIPIKKSALIEWGGIAALILLYSAELFIFWAHAVSLAH